MENYMNENLILQIKDLNCGYGIEQIIKGFNLEVYAGERVAVTGKNGCGKSTLMKAIFQLCEINSGEIIFKNKLINGYSVDEVRKVGISWFMQKDSIYPNLTIFENIYLSILNNNKHIKNKVNDILNFFPDLKNKSKKNAGLLSGGQRQQLALAMLFAQDTSLWLIDEPTADLDNENSYNFIEKITEYSNISSDPKTIIFIEHRKEIINKLATKIINLK